MEKEKKETVEKETTKKEKTKKGIKTTNFQVTLIVILLICCAGFGGWILGASKVNFMYREAIDKNDTNANTTKKSDKTNNNTSNDTTVKNQDTSDEIKALDLTKSLNTTNTEYSDAKELVNGNEMLGLSVKANGSNTKLSINWSEFGRYSTASSWPDTTEEYAITNLSENVKEGYVGGLGHDSVGTTLFYLMNDGTVEYTKVFTKKFDSNGALYFNINYIYEKDAYGRSTGEHFESQGKIDGVNNIVKLYSANASTGTSGFATVIAATKDGSFYDLANIIE